MVFFDLLIGFNKLELEILRTVDFSLDSLLVLDKTCGLIENDLLLFSLLVDWLYLGQNTTDYVKRASIYSLDKCYFLIGPVLFSNRTSR